MTLKGKINMNINKKINILAACRPLQQLFFLQSGWPKVQCMLIFAAAKSF